MSFLLIPITEEERILAGQALMFIEDAFAKEGLSMLEALEIEFFVIGDDPDDPMAISRDALAAELQKLRILPDHLQKINQKLGIEKFRPARVIEDLYKESKGKKYEATMFPTAPSRAVTRAEGIKRSIAREVDARYLVEGIDHVDFHAINERRCPSMHANSSLLKLIGGKNVFTIPREDFTDFTAYLEFLMSQKYLARDVAEGMKPALHETTLLQAPNPSSYLRYNLPATTSETLPNMVAVEVNDKTKKGIAIRYNSDTYDIRIENRIPGDAEPLLVILATALALYIGWKNKDKPYPPDMEIPKTLTDAIKIFSEGKLFRETLNELSGSTLGDKLHEAMMRKYKLYQKEIQAEEIGVFIPSFNKS